MGEVWLALDEELGERPVAIKRMHSRMLADGEGVARFQREMRLAARMQHPNIMTLFTTGTDNGVPFMVMEYLEGQDLGKTPRAWGADEVAGPAGMPARRFSTPTAWGWCTAISRRGTCSFAAQGR